MTAQRETTMANLGDRHIELHLNNDPELPKKYGKRILAVGGGYTKRMEKRFVHLPEADVALAVELIKKFPGYEHRSRTAVVLRGRERSESCSSDRVVYIWHDKEDQLTAEVAKFAAAQAETRTKREAAEQEARDAWEAGKPERCRDDVRAMLKTYGARMLQEAIAEVMPLEMLREDETDYEGADRRGDLYEQMLGLVKQHGLADVEYVLPVVKEDLSQ